MRILKTISVLVILLFCVLLNSINTHAATEATNDLITATEVDYINNKGTGKYLMGNSSTLTSASGLLSNMGSLIKWTITPLGNNTYTIQSASSSLYLAASADTSTTTLYLITLDDPSIPNRYRWKITTATGGGCLIKNVHTSKYMYANGTTISSSSTLGSYGIEQYNRRVWRIAESTCYYGNNSGYTKIELPAGYEFKTLYLFTGQTKAPALLDTYNNVLYGNAYDFTYSGYDTAKVLINPATGKFTASSTLTDIYSTVISVTHKVTGRTSSLYLVINPSSLSLGIPADGHDHTTPLYHITTDILDCGYHDNVRKFGTYTVNNVRSFIDNYCNNIFVSRSHGYYHTVGGVVDYTALVIGTDSLGEAILFRSDTSMAGLELSNMKLMVFVGCTTGAGGAAASNLPHKAVQLGATVAIGFKNTIDCSTANAWVEDFFNLLNTNSCTVNQAINVLNISYSGTGLYDPTVCGNSGVKIQNN